MSRHAYHTRPSKVRAGRFSRPESHPRRWTDLFGLNVLRQRWSNAMPKFFRIICWSCALVSGTALAANTAIVAGGGVTHEWWNDIYPYLLGVPAGMAFVAKFTQNYDRNGNPIQKPAEHKNQQAYNNSDVETAQPEMQG